jgi:hypothetical protein
LLGCGDRSEEQHEEKKQTETKWTGVKDPRAGITLICAGDQEI